MITVVLSTRSSDAVITVREVLALPAVARGVPEVVAGDAQLDRPVRWAHSGEVPYMAEMLKGGELLLMTGIGIGRGEREQRRFVADLSTRGICGLMIELGPRFQRLPAALVDEARQRELPLVVLHQELRFVEVTEAVHREIVGRQLEAMRRGEELHRRFTDLMLSGAGVPEVLAELADVVANPVILEKQDEGVLYHASGGSDDDAVLAAWDAFVRRLPGAPSAVDQPVPTTDEEPWGRLVALALERPLDAAARMAVERAVGLVALALLRERTEEALASRERGNFLAGLLEGDVDEAQARRRAATAGFDPGDRLLVPLAIARAPGAPRRLDDEALWTRVWSDLRRELDGWGVPAITGTRGRQRELLVVLAIRGHDARTTVAEQFAQLVADACARHLGRSDAALVCVGPAAASWDGLGAGLRTTVDGLAPAAHSQARPWHDVMRPDLDALLWSLRDRPAVRRFAESRLAPLVEHDRRRKAELLPTLAALCRHGGRKAETARALHIERQSLYHRLARIEELLDVDLSDGETLLDLHLAVRAREGLAAEAARGY
jgi:PucR family transcriptional regulator, purine catabolism regulatory protein